MFIPYQGKTQAEPFAKKASTAIAVGDALVFDSGYITPAAAGATVTAGVALKAVTSADDDYTATTAVPVVMLTPDLVFLADVGTGSATQADVGVAYNLTDAGSVNLSDTTPGTVTVVGVISATKVLVKFNSAYEFLNA